MTVKTNEPMTTPLGQASDSLVDVDAVIQSQDTGTPSVATTFPPCGRAFFLLDGLQARQGGLCRSAALAWERAAFAEVFDHPDPGQRIRRFLEKA